MNQNADNGNPGYVSQKNSSTTSLTSGSVFTGTAEEVSQYSQLTVYLGTDVASATNGLSLELSSDGVNWDRKKQTTSPAGGGAHTLVIISRYFRIKYTNGSTNQTYMRLQVIYHKYKSKELTSTLTQTLDDGVDVQNTRSVIVAKNSNGAYQNVVSNEYGELQVSASNENIFGDMITTPYNLIVQSYAPYGMINNQVFTQFTATGGTIIANTNGVEIDFNITSSIGSYATLRSRKVVHYRPGFTNLFRTSARFNSAVANSLQFVGLGNAGSDLYFAHNGTDFGVRRSTSGLTEVRTLTISAAATGAETATITLNGVAFTATLSNAGGDIDFTAHESEVGDTYTGWNVEHVGDKIIFSGAGVGARSGTYSFSSTGAATGSFTQDKAGSALTTEFVAQSAWNGYSSLKDDLDFTKNNLFQIQYSWFGSSNIVFSIYNSSTARFEVAHTMTFANTETAVSLTQPNMFVQQGLASLGSTTAMTLTSTCSMAATMGPILIEAPIHSVSNTKALSSNTETNILVIKNRNTVNGYANQSTIYISRITLAADGNRPVRVRLIKNPTAIGASTTGDYHNYQFVDSANSLIIYDTDSDTYTGGDVIDTFFVGKNGFADLTFEKTLELDQSDEIVITAFSTATNTFDISISFIDDI